jgi:hypothetical protein
MRNNGGGATVYTARAQKTKSIRESHPSHMSGSLMFKPIDLANTTMDQQQILECILQQCSTSTLAAAARVSRHWSKLALDILWSREVVEVEALFSIIPAVRRTFLLSDFGELLPQSGAGAEAIAVIQSKWDELGTDALFPLPEEELAFEIVRILTSFHVPVAPT